MKLVVDFGHVHGNAYTLPTALADLVYFPITNIMVCFINREVYLECGNILLVMIAECGNIYCQRH